MKEDNNKSRISLAGEFAVLSQLALRGKDANMTLGNTKGVDILVSDPKTNNMFKVEVKTNYSNNHKNIKSKIFGEYLNQWILSKKNEEYDEKKDSKLFFCFVNINENTKQFKFYLIHSKIVADYLKREHLLWINEKKNEGKKVKNSEMRTFRIGIDKKVYKILTPIDENYENNWEFKI